MAMKVPVLHFYILLLSIGALSCSNDTVPPAAENMPSSAMVPRVIIQDVIEGPVYKTYTSVGSVGPEDIARIMPRVEGRIEIIAVEEGDPVDKDQLLMLIDTFDYEKALEKTTAIANQAKASLDRIARDLSRMQALYNNNSISEQVYQEMLTSYDLARYQYDQAISAEALARSKLRECSVRSPISGIATQKFVNVGELASPAQLAFVIMNMDTVKVEADLPEEIYGSLKQGGTGMITFDAIPVKSYTGKITKIYPTIDPVSRTFKIRIILKNPGLDLRSGMTARIGVVEKTRDRTLSVPKSAVIKGEQGYFIYTVMADTVKKKVVTLGIEGDALFEITSGISLGDQVVTTGLAGLRDNMKVTVQETPDLRE
ncbi:MAG TPA: efflux RND transporter periplasmic adaptor subunit [Deltaproteobacteria bacterium]|nr:efflux RND transporter periplasmic adaptor subunit [Deltaproteobacteria bacterium]